MAGLSPLTSTRRIDLHTHSTASDGTTSPTDLMREAREARLDVIALTDHATSPIAALSDAVLTVPEVDFGAFRALSATLALAMTLAVATGTARG